MTYPTLTTVPKELYYHEVAYVRRLESDKADLLAALREIARRDQHDMGCDKSVGGPGGMPCDCHVSLARDAIAKAERA